MVTFRLHKLVRDNYGRIYADNNQKPEFRLLRHEEHVKELAKKIVEEASELTRVSVQEMAGEIVDVEQALEDLKALCGIDDSAIAQAKQARLSKFGGFKQGRFIETLQLHDDDPWVEYYRKEPDRFTEIQ